MLDDNHTSSRANQGWQQRRIKTDLEANKKELVEYIRAGEVLEACIAEYIGKFTALD